MVNIWDYPEFIGIDLTWWLVALMVFMGIAFISILVAIPKCFKDEKGTVCRVAIGSFAVSFVIFIAILVFLYITSFYIIAFGLQNGWDALEILDLTLALIIIFAGLSLPSYAVKQYNVYRDGGRVKVYTMDED